MSMTATEWQQKLGRNSCAWCSGATLYLCEHTAHKYQVPCAWVNCPIAREENSFTVAKPKILNPPGGVRKEWKCRTEMISSVIFSDYMHHKMSLSRAIERLVDVSPANEIIKKINLEYVE